MSTFRTKSPAADGKEYRTRLSACSVCLLITVVPSLLNRVTVTAVGRGPLKLIWATSPATPKAAIEVVSVGRFTQTVSPWVPCTQLLTAMASKARPSTISTVAGTETPGISWTLPWPVVGPVDPPCGNAGIGVGLSCSAVGWAKVGSGIGVAEGRTGGTSVATGVVGTAVSGEGPDGVAVTTTGCVASSTCVAAISSVGEATATSWVGPASA